MSPAVYLSSARGREGETVVFARNYGEAGALEYYAETYPLPRVISTHNSYWFWGYPQGAARDDHHPQGRCGTPPTGLRRGRPGRRPHLPLLHALREQPAHLHLPRSRVSRWPTSGEKRKRSTDRRQRRPELPFFRTSTISLTFWSRSRRQIRSASSVWTTMRSLTPMRAVSLPGLWTRQFPESRATVSPRAALPVSSRGQTSKSDDQAPTSDQPKSPFVTRTPSPSPSGRNRWKARGSPRRSEGAPSRPSFSGPRASAPRTDRTRGVPLELAGERVRAPEEHARVPQIAARGEESLGGFDVRLLLELEDGKEHLARHLPRSSRPRNGCSRSPWTGTSAGCRR